MAAVIGGVIGAGAELLITHGTRWQEGWAIGTTIGAIIDGSKKVGITSGKLTDQHIAGSSYGTTWPLLWGKHKTAGTGILWVGNYINNKTPVPSYAGYQVTCSATLAGATHINATVNSNSGTIPTGTYVTDGAVVVVVTSTGHIVGGNVTLTVTALGSNIPSGAIIQITAGTHLVQHKKKSGSGGGGSGGGGSETTTYWYTASFAIGVMMASMVMNDGTFVNHSPVVKRIWANDKLVYDVDNTSINKLDITFHSGSESQLPDTLIESFEGAGNVPGYRGRNYFVIESMDLTEYGQTIPNFQMEVWTSSVNVGNVTSDVLGMVGIQNLNTNTTAPATLHATSLSVSPMTAPMFIGSTLNFGATSVTLTADAPVGTTTLSVSAISAPISSLVNARLRTLIDTSLATAAITGYIITSIGNAQTALDSLFSLYITDIVGVDGLVKLIPRGGSTIGTITADQMGAVVEGSEITSRLTRVRGVRGELHSQVNLLYFDVNRSFQQVPQTDLKQTADYRNINSITTSLALAATEAKQMVSRILEIEYNELDPYNFTTDLTFDHWIPTDPILIVDQEGLTFRCRIVDAEYGDPGEIKFTAVVDSVNVSTQVVIGDSGSGGSTPGTNVAIPSTFLAWSGIELQDDDKASPGLYVVATGIPGWRGGVVYYSTDGGTTYNQSAAINDRSIFGEATSALANGTSNDYWDTTNDVDVTINDDGLSVIETVSQDAVMNGSNIAMIGTELCGFADVTPIGVLACNLSTLRRGMRASAYVSHSSPEKFVVVTDAVQRINLASSYVGTTVKVKVVSPYQTLADVTEQDVVVLARTLTPAEQTLTSHASLIASGSQLGHVKIGAGLTVDGSGVLSLTPTGHTSVNNANHTVGPNEQLITITNLTAPRAFTLPDPTGGSAALPYDFVTIKDQSGLCGTFNVTVTPTASLIDGAASFVLSANYQSMTFYHNGVNYFLV